MKPDLRVLEWKCALALGAIVFLFFGSVLVLPRTLFFGDIISYVGRLAFTGRWLREGRFPLWNPFLSLGGSQAADPVAMAFYPPHLLLTLVLGDRFYDLDAALHVWWAAVGTFVLARLQRHSRPAALLASIALAFGGFASAHLQHLNILVATAWIPWVLAAVERYVARRDRRSLALGAIAVGLLVLGGHPQLTLYGFGAQAAYCAYRIAALAREARWRSALRIVAGLLALDALGLAVAAVFLLPFAEWMHFVARSEQVTAGYATRYSLPLPRLAGLVAPFWLGGSPDRPHYASSLVEYSSYAGVVALALAVVGAARPRGKALFFLLLATTAVALSLGGASPLYKLVLALPVLSSVRAPARFMLLAELSVALLAASGLDALRAAERRRPARVMAVALVSLAGLVAWAAWLRQRSAVLLPQRPDAVRFSQPDTLILLSTLLGAAAVLWALSTQRETRPTILALTLVFATVDVWAFRSRLFFYASAPAATWSQRSNTAEEMLRRGGTRFYSQVGKETVSLVYDARDFAAYRRQAWESLSMSLPMRYGLQSASGYMAEPPAYAPLSVLRRETFDSGAARVGGVFGVRWIIASPGRQIAAPELTLAARGVFDLYLNRVALPRAYLARESRTVPDPKLLSELLADPSFDPTETVLLDIPGPATQRGPLLEALATIVRDEPDRVVVATRSSRPAWLVLSDTFAPGWAAFVDGRSRRIWRANGLVRAVIVPGGTHRVEFVYAPLSVRLGLAISGSALVLVGFLLLRGPRSPSAPAVSGGLPARPRRESSRGGSALGGSPATGRA